MGNVHGNEPYMFPNGKIGRHSLSVSAFTYERLPMLVVYSHASSVCITHSTQQQLWLLCKFKHTRVVSEQSTIATQARLCQYQTVSKAFSMSGNNSFYCP